RDSSGTGVQTCALPIYATVGVGLYNMGLKLDTPSGNTSDSNSELGFNVGGGLNFLTSSNVTWGLAGAYHIVNAKNDMGSNVNFAQGGVNVLWGPGEVARTSQFSRGPVGDASRRASLLSGPRGPRHARP